MKIENNRKIKEVKFEELHLGDCFEHGNDLYLKTENIYDDIDGYVEYNCAMLADGALAYFEESDLVKSVNAKIVIE